MKKRALLTAVALVLAIAIFSMAGCSLIDDLFGSTTEPQRYIIDVGQVEDSRAASIVANNSIGSCVRITAKFKNGVTSYSSGFIVSSDGYVVTNRHCIVHFTDGSDLPSNNNRRLDAEYTVTDADGNKYNAEYVNYSATADIGLLKIKPTTLESLVGTKQTFTPLVFDTVNLPYYGDRVYTIGNPENLGFVMSELMVAAPAAIINSGDKFSTILLDGNINHGNSGGALLNVKGYVVGIVFARIETSANDTFGLGCAIPATEITDFLKDNNVEYLFYTPQDADSDGESAE